MLSVTGVGDSVKTFWDSSEGEVDVRRNSMPEYFAFKTADFFRPVNSIMIPEDSPV